MQRAEKKKAFIESRLLSKTDIDELRLPDELSEFNDQLKRLSEASDDNKSKRRLKVIHRLITNNLTNGDPLERPQTIDRIKRTFTDEIKNDTNNFGRYKMENKNTTKRDKKPLNKNVKPRNDKSHPPHSLERRGEEEILYTPNKNLAATNKETTPSSTDSAKILFDNILKNFDSEFELAQRNLATITTPESSHHREINHHTDSDTDTDTDIDPKYSPSSVKNFIAKEITRYPRNLLDITDTDPKTNLDISGFINAFPEKNPPYIDPHYEHSPFIDPNAAPPAIFTEPQHHKPSPEPQHQIIKQYKFSTVNNVDLIIQRDIETWIKSTQKNFVLICKDKFYLMNRNDFVDTNDIMRANWAFFNYKFHRLILPDETSDMNYVLNQTDVENIKKGKDLFYELVRFKQINTVDQKWKEFRDNYRTLQKLQNPDWKSSTASTGAFNVNTTFRRRRRPHNPSTVNTDLRDKSTLLLQMQQFLDSHSSKHNITNVENITEAQVQKLRQVNACLLARVESVPRTYLEYLLETKGKRPRSKWWLRLTRRLRSNLKTYGGGRGRGGRGRTKKRLHYR